MYKDNTIAYNEDSTKVDYRGEELLGHSKALNPAIINGMKTGDLFGKITSYQWNGKFVVDYAISSADCYYILKQEIIPHISPLPITFRNTPTGNYDFKEKCDQFEKTSDDFYFHD